jgi:glycosyltransferase involved in cell wall biosynthesis
MITIGITTYNRLETLKKMAESLYNSDIGSSNIRVYDDCSDEYNINELKRIFPTAVSIIRNTHTIKADKNMYQMYCDFLSSSDNYFFNADSDLIFYPQWLKIALELIQHTEGILSLFNANSHPGIKTVNENLSIKRVIGAAGTLFTRKRLEELVSHFSNMDDFHSFDWRWSEYFSTRNIPIYCTNSSLVQHIGYIGQNSGNRLSHSFDFGRNFKITAISQGQIINDIFESYLDGLSEFHKEQKRRTELLDNDLVYHIKKIIKIIIKKILPKHVVILLKKRYKKLFRTG